MAVLTVAQKLTIAEINEYLISVAIMKGNTAIDIQLPQKIRNLRKSIQYQYDADPSIETLDGTSNYMLGLCLYVNAAKAIILNPGTVSGIIATTSPSPYQFTVDASTSFIIDGQSSKTITAFIGYNLLFTRGGVTQSTVDPGGGLSYYSWTKATGSFICYPAAATGEDFGLFPI